MKSIYAWLHNHVHKTSQNVTRLDVVDYNKSSFITQVLFLTWWQRRQDPRCIEAY